MCGSSIEPLGGIDNLKLYSRPLEKSLCVELAHVAVTKENPS
jgi:hypothetical protein